MMWLLVSVVHVILVTGGNGVEHDCIEQDATISDNYPLIRLPRIDLSQYRNGDITDKQQVVSSFNQYMHEYGTLSLYNHGISAELIERVESLGMLFFQKDNEYKAKFASNGVGSPGYDSFLSLGASRAYGDPDNEGDYNEMFAFFNHIPNDESMYDEYYPLKENAPSEIYDVAMEYITNIHRVLETLHNITSDALLGIDANNTDYFNNLYRSTPHLQLRWFYYPEQNNSEQLSESNKYRLSQHKDFLGFTLFHPGDSRGLQNRIGGKNGVWVDCQTNKDLKYDIFVNTGELFDVWTNGYWPSNLHRAVVDNKERITFAYLSGPDNDLMVEPIKECFECTKEEQIYASRTAAQHAKLRFGQTDNVNPNGLKFFSD